MKLKVFVFVTLALAGYVVGGGYLFQYLEYNFAQQNSQTIVTLLQDQADLEDFLVKLLEKVVSANFLASEWSLNLTIEETPKNDTSDGADDLYLRAEVTMRKRNNWDIYGAIFYAETLVTATGYGHIVPGTETGRMITCFYAIIGIPVMGVWAVAFGEYLILIATFIRKKITKRPEEHHLRRLIIQALGVIIIGSAVFIFSPAALFSSMEGWYYSDGFYFCVVTLTTIGFGDLVAGIAPSSAVWYRIIVNLWLFFGLGWLTVIISLIVKLFGNKATQVVEKVDYRVSHFATEVRQRYFSTHIPRANSFSGSQQVSVLDSRRSSKVHVVDLATGDSTQIVGVGEHMDVHGFFRQVSQANTPSIVVMSEDGDNLSSMTLTPGPSSVASRQHSLSPMPSIMEEGETGQGNLMEEIWKAQRLHRLMHGRPPQSDASQSPRLQRVSSRRALSENIRHRNAANNHGHRSNAHHLRPPATRRRAESVISSNSTAVKTSEDARNVVVVTSQGIAQTLDREITVLRPRSKSH